MRLLVVTWALLMALSGIASAQDDADSGQDPAAADATVAEANADQQGDENSAEDEDELPYPEEDSDDFIPSEEISADQSVPFPVDI